MARRIGLNKTAKVSIPNSTLAVIYSLTDVLHAQHDQRGDDQYKKH
jgi:hypothetical protein